MAVFLLLFVLLFWSPLAVQERVVSTSFATHPFSGKSGDRDQNPGADVGVGCVLGPPSSPVPQACAAATRGARAVVQQGSCMSALVRH